MSFALFTEHSDITDALMKTPNVGIAELLGDAQAASVLKYLMVSLFSVSQTGPPDLVSLNVCA